jgi:hypothetical protein
LSRAFHLAQVPVPPAVTPLVEPLTQIARRVLTESAVLVPPVAFPMEGLRMQIARLALRVFHAAPALRASTPLDRRRAAMGLVLRDFFLLEGALMPSAHAAFQASAVAAWIIVVAGLVCWLIDMPLLQHLRKIAIVQQLQHKKPTITDTEGVAQGGVRMLLVPQIF